MVSERFHPRPLEEVQVVIPPRYCPLPTTSHPNGAQLNERGAEWVNGFGLCLEGAQRARMIGNDCGGFYGRIMPFAQTDRLQLAVDWCVLMFAFDDGYCEEGPARVRVGQFADLATRILRVLEVPEAAMGEVDDGFMAAVSDLAARAHTDGTIRQVRRVVEAHRTWFLAVLWEFGRRIQNRTPALNDYAYMRQHTAAATATMSWAEIVDRAEIADEVMDAPAVRALTEIASAIAAFDDDLYSYGKELWLAARNPEASGCRLNLVDILIDEHRLTFEQAMAEAVDLCNHLTLRFIELRNQVLPAAGHELRLYLEHLSYLVRGNIEWGLRAGRYTNPDGLHPGAVTTIGSFTDVAPAKSGLPVSIPAIAWWWDVTP
jgi:Terpene synthase family 2, C-terminal metal binding